MKRYTTVLLGGTFDRIHNGHRALFEAAIHNVRNDGGARIIIGVTSPSLLKNKVHERLIKPLQARIDQVRDEVSEIMRDNGVHCQLDVYELTTSLGPAATDHFPDPALVVSEETETGG